MPSVQVVKSLSDRVKVCQPSDTNCSLVSSLTFQLADGNSIPQLGLGVYEMSDKETYASVKSALQAGYKHIDTAEWYNSHCYRVAKHILTADRYENEAPCGKAINEYLGQLSASQYTKQASADSW